MKSTRSMRSLRSIRSVKSLRAGRDLKKGDSVLQSFENMLNAACMKYKCSYTVIVNKETNNDDYYMALMKPDVKGRSKRMSFISQAPENTSKAASTDSSDCSIFHSEPAPMNPIIVTMLYDKFNTLTEIVITNIKDVPRILLKIIRVLVPFYENLTRITISKCKIDMYTIHELSKMLKDSTINSICLDGSAMPLGDFSMLLNTSNLISLSLCRCNLNDDDCKLIASKLHGLAPANNLLLLNLTSNRITDVGAKYIADSLRTNRHLRYLNLADNHIEDDGAGYILDVLMEFPLTYNEIMTVKKRRLEYYKLKNDLYTKYLSEYCNKNTSFDDISHTSASRKKKNKIIPKIEKHKQTLSSWANEEYFKTRAEMMTIDVLGHFRDPFQPDSIKFKDNYYHCLGNMTLQYLNLAYNNLSYLSIKKLCNVIIYQNDKRSGNRGLTKVVVDGNNLPITCIEMDTIKEILSRKIMRYSGRISEVVRRKSRPLKEMISNNDADDIKKI